MDQSQNNKQKLLWRETNLPKNKNKQKTISFPTLPYQKQRLKRTPNRNGSQASTTSEIYTMFDLYKEKIQQCNYIQPATRNQRATQTHSQTNSTIIQAERVSIGKTNL